MQQKKHPSNPVTPPTTTATHKSALLAALAALPDEAFGFLVAALATGVWPDGLGGFKPESKAAIVAVRKLAADYPGE